MFIWSRVAIILLCCAIGYIIALSQYRLQNMEFQEMQHRLNLSAKQNRAIAERQIFKNMATALDYYKAYKMYYNGIPDKYDLNGNKINGIKPDSTKAINYLSRAYEISKEPSLLLQLGSIYQNGMYKFEPNLPMAQRIYTQILNNYPDLNMQYEVQDRLNDVVNEINNIKTYNWLNIKYTPKNLHHEKIDALINKNRQVPRLDLNRHDPIQTNQTAPETTVFVDVNAIQYNDQQNTHNSQVVGTVANSLKKLKENTELKRSISDTMRDIRNYLNGKPNCDRKNDALKSLDSIERNIIPLNSVDMKETEALNIVWNRINSDKHLENQNDIKDMFYHQLADMQEHGRSVCATGRLSRMLDTLSTFDNDVQIKPTYVIDKEMMEKAGKLREDMYAKYDSSVVDKLRAGTAPSNIQEEFDKKAREEIIGTLTKEYVDSGIMTQNAFVKSVNEWVDDI